MTDESETVTTTARRDGGPASATRPRLGLARHPGHPRRSGLVGWVLMSPSLAVLLLMTIVPVIYLLYSSLRSDTLLGGTGTFIGLQNYQDALTDAGHLHSLLITLGFVAVAVLLEPALGLLLAVPMAAQTRSNNFAVALMVLPFAVTPVVSALVMRELLNPNYGWVDYFMSLVGLPSHVDWLGDPTMAWIAIIGMDVWQWTPFVALILMAGLQSLPREPVESAAIDGAGAWQTFRHVTLPMLTPFVAIAMVLRMIQAFKTFDSFKVLTGGGPGVSTEVVNLEIYRVALQSFRIGAAAAVAMLFLILLTLLVPLLLRIVGRNADPEVG
jgi:multiple sugar transport system permease protein